MAVSFNFEMGLLQYAMIGGLVLVVILGIWNQSRMKKKKLAEEEAMTNMSSSSSYKSSNSTFSDEEKAPLKIYIDQYKGQYGREALFSALKNTGYGEDLINSCLDEFL